MRVHRGRTSGAGRVARRSFAGWALVAAARQGGELAPFGRSDSAALPPRLRSSHPAEFASGPAPRVRGPPPSRGRPDLSGGRVRLVRVYVRNQAASAYQCATSPRAWPESGWLCVPVRDTSACVSGIGAKARTSACHPKRGPSPLHTDVKRGPSLLHMRGRSPVLVEREGHALYCLAGQKGRVPFLIDGLGRLLLLRERGGRAWRAARAWRCRRRNRSTWRPEP